MNRLTKTIFVSVLTSFTVASAHADVILNTFAGAAPGYSIGTSGWSISTTQQIDRPFAVTGSYNLTSIDVVLALLSTSASTFNLQLRSDTGGNPGSLLESFSINVPGSSNNSLYSVSSLLNPLLTTGSYHLIVSTTDASADGGWGFSNDGHSSPLKFSTNSGTSWSGFSGSDVAAQINGTQIVPEPATLAVLGLGALALVRRRRSIK